MKSFVARFNCTEDEYVAAVFAVMRERGGLTTDKFPPEIAPRVEAEIRAGRLFAAKNGPFTTYTLNQEN